MASLERKFLFALMAILSGQGDKSIWERLVVGSGQGTNSIHYKGEVNMLNILTFNMPGHVKAVWAEKDRE